MHRRNRKPWVFVVSERHLEEMVTKMFIVVAEKAAGAAEEAQS
jgi:hypothetical protein